jgi:hypothetical protein
MLDIENSGVNLLGFPALATKNKSAKTQRITSAALTKSTNTIINLKLLKNLKMNKNELCRKFLLPFQGFNLHSPIPL